MSGLISHKVFSKITLWKGVYSHYHQNLLFQHNRCLCCCLEGEDRNEITHLSSLPVVFHSIPSWTDWRKERGKDRRKTPVPTLSGPSCSPTLLRYVPRAMSLLMARQPPPSDLSQATLCPPIPDPQKLRDNMCEGNHLVLRDVVTQRQMAVILSQHPCFYGLCPESHL